MIAVLGNHDHWSGAEEVRHALERGGVEVLRNRHTTITLRHERLQVVGLDDAYTGHARRDEAVKGLRHDLPSIALSHIAEEADGLWRHGVPLVLSGHTHAGQVTLARLHEFAVGRDRRTQIRPRPLRIAPPRGTARESRTGGRGLRRRRHRRRGGAVPLRRSRQARGHDVRARLRAGRLRRAPRRAGAAARDASRRSGRSRGARRRCCASGCAANAGSDSVARPALPSRLSTHAPAALLVGQRVMATSRHGQYTLPDLPYDYGALEPHISGKIMRLHHDKHHRAYVTGANEALDGLAEARAQATTSRGSRRSNASSRSTCRGTCCTRCSGRTWRRRAGGEPTGALADQIDARLRRFLPLPRRAEQRRGDDHGLGLGGADAGIRWASAC